jgi:hypothetical protein
VKILLGHLCLQHSTLLNINSSTLKNIARFECFFACTEFGESDNLLAWGHGIDQMLCKGLIGTCTTSKSSLLKVCKRPRDEGIIG